MSLTKTQGKKRALEQPEDQLGEVDSGMPTPPERKAKKLKRGDTRKCPVCEDDIPVRLLVTHEVFELQRVEQICRARTEDDDLVPWEQIEADMFSVAGPSRRGAAMKARRSFATGSSSQSRASLGSATDLLARVSKTLKLVQRHRRERHIKLKEMSKADLEDDAGVPRTSGDGTRVCPVCQTTVSGDVDVVEAHVDACLVHAAASAAASGGGMEADGLEEYEAGGQTRIRIAGSVDFRGAGFDVRNPLHNDVEDEIDIDGDDSFGAAQFTERDIIVPESLNSTEDEEVKVDSDDDEDSIPLAQQERIGTSLRDLVAQGKAVLRADTAGVATPGVISTDPTALGGLICRICIDAYTEPTVSTGCWHTCCKDCWLRCLGSTKLCPICKRITAAGDLRRIYL